VGGRRQIGWEAAVPLTALSCRNEEILLKDGAVLNMALSEW
jgi:hypothetical protein